MDESTGAPARRTPWSYDEIVVVCAAVAANGWKAFASADHPEVVALSDLLRRASPTQAADPAFRNPNGVKRKSHDIATARSDYHGTPTKGGQTTIDVVREFESTPQYMHQCAQAIRESMADP